MSRTQGKSTTNFLRKLIKKHRKSCDFLEIRHEEINTLSMSFTDKMESIYQEQNSGFALRVIHQGGVVFASVMDIDTIDALIPELVEKSLLLGEGGTKLAPAQPQKRRAVLRLKEDPRTLSLSEKRDYFRAINQSILTNDPLISNSSCSYHESFSKRNYFNSEGTETYLSSMDLFASIAATATNGSIRQMDHDTVGTSNDFAVVRNLPSRVNEICKMAVRLTEVPKVEGGQYTVILEPVLGGIFVHEAFGHTAEADGIVDSEDKMKIMAIGTPLGSEKLTIYDTGMVRGSRGYLPFDDEGVPSQKSYLIRNGVICGHLHSRLTADKMNTVSTGSARAIDFRHPPIVRMRSTCIEEGHDTLKDMMAGVEDGLYCCKSNGGTGGEMFTFTTSYVWRIKNGKKTELMRDATLSGNLFTTLNNIDMIGNDFSIREMGGGCGKGGQFPLPVATGSPHIRIQNVVVGGDA